MDTHILLVTTEPASGESLDLLLRRAGYMVTILADPHAGMAALGDVAIALLLLVGMPPDIAGLPLLTTLRGGYPDLPVLLLSPHGAVDDEIAALRGGADDVLALSCESELLLARIAALLRRAPPSRMTVTVGDAALDLGALCFTAPGQPPAHLTPVEARLLECLMRGAGNAVPRAALREWIGVNSGDHRPDFYIRRLRAKIEEDPGRPRWIRSVPGTGYEFRSGRDRG